MIKVKDGYAKLIGTTYSGSVSRVLLSNGGDHILGNSNGNIPLNNGTVNTNLNADMLDGLHIHAGRNNEVNKIVRTDTNGFLLTGWINTTSGDIGAGAINKIYCSYDNYIRYKTPANFFSTLANSGNDISITVAGLNRKLTVGYATNADTVDGFHYNRFVYNSSFGYHRNGPYYKKIASVNTANWTWSSASLVFEVFSTGYSNGVCYLGTVEVTCGHWNNTDHDPSVTCRWILKVPNSGSKIVTIKNLNTNTIDVYLANDLWDCGMTFNVIYNNGFSILNVSLTDGGFVNLPTASSTIIHYTPSNPTYVGNSTSATNSDTVDGIHANGLLTALSNSNNGISITVGGTTKSVSNISVNYASNAGSATSATKVIVNLHTSNDINYPLVWSNLANTSNVTENQLYKSWADLYYNPKNKRLTVGGSVVTSSFIKSGGNYSQLLRADGGVATFNWSGLSGLPAWLWGGNNLHSYYVYNPSNFRVAYAASAGNADTLDGEHASSFVRAGHYESLDLNKLDTYSFIRSVNSNNKDTSPKGSIGWYNVILLVHRNGADDGPSYIGQIALGMTTNTNDMFFRGKRTDPWKTVIHSGNIGSQTVANAYHLRINSANSWSTWNWVGLSGQPSWLWGSNDGTNMYVWNPSNFNVNTALYLRSLGNLNCQTGRTLNYGDVYTYNTHSSNTGSPTTYTSVIGFGRGTAGTVEIAGGWCNTNLYWRSLRDCCEDWFSWRTVLDDSNYASVLNNTYLPLAGGTMKGGVRISHGDGPLYIGRADNNSWLYVLDMASQAGEANWKIYANGTASFKNLTVNGPTVVNGSTTLNSVTTLNGLVTNNRGILPASYDVNKNNIGCYVWGDAMSTGVTAITDALDPKYVSVHYSNDNGASWYDMGMSVLNKFSLYANNGDRNESVYLGHLGVAESLTQVLKNQLMVTFEIPSTMYSALCWASIDISEGVLTTCTVEIIARDGTIKNTFTKNLYGWNALNYINFWGNNSPVVNIGLDSARFVRFKFKHDSGNTLVRNALILKIRLFSFTKYNLNINDRRSLMAYTGHLYTYDLNLNVKFPNALNVGGILTITPTSNGYYGEANYPGAVIDTYYNNNYLQIGKSNGELILDTNSDKGNINPALYIKDFVSANRLFKFNTGLAVPPVHLMNDSNADDTITILNEKYKAYYVGTLGNAIGKSFILADNSIDYKLVIVIRKGVDGEVCFIKDEGKETFRYYLQDTLLMLAGDQTIQKSGTFSFGFDDGKARFIIYSVINNMWYEFYCG